MNNNSDTFYGIKRCNTDLECRGNRGRNECVGTTSVCRGGHDQINYKEKSKIQKLVECVIVVGCPESDRMMIRIMLTGKFPMIPRPVRYAMDITSVMEALDLFVEGMVDVHVQ